MKFKSKTARPNFGVRYIDTSLKPEYCWLRSDGYATVPGSAVGAWSGTREEAERLIAIGVPLGPAEVAELPLGKESDQ